MKDAPGTRDYDWWLVAILAAICALGVIEIYSATHGSALVGMHTKQIRWLVVGVVLMFALSRVDYHLIMDQAPVLYIIGIVALLAVLLVGHTRFGAKRWIPILGEFLQVSELVKLIIIIVLARFFAEVRTDELSLQDLIKAGLIVGLPLALILKQPDLGTALVLMPMLVVGAFLAGLQWKHAAAIVLIGVMMLPVGWHFMKPYQKERVTSFLHPEEDAKGSGYQVLQSKIAVGSGGALGIGLMQGRQKLFYLPEAHTDFIYAVVGEELGLFGCTAVLAGFLLLLWRGLRLYWLAPDDFGRYLALALTASIVFQALINMSVVLGLGPTKGIPLPMISFGGSSLLSTLISCGLLLSVSDRVG